MLKYKLNWTAPDGFFGNEYYFTLWAAEEAKRDYERQGCSCVISEINRENEIPEPSETRS